MKILLRVFDLLLRLSKGRLFLDILLMKIGTHIWDFSSLTSIEDANVLIKNTSTDNGKSCIRHNCVNDNPEFDLQIIIPAYNVEKYIRQCLDSVMHNVTKYKVQIVVVDDGSTDNTSKIVDEYTKVSGFRIIHQKNKGLSGARNTALSEINAEYIMFIDSDDILMPGAIEVMMDNIKKMKSDMLVADYVYLYKGIKLSSRRKMKICCDISKSKIYGFPWGKIYKAKLFENIVFPENYWFEDTVLKMVLNRKCKRISTIPNVVYCYRKNPKGISMSSKGNNKSLDSFYITRRLLHDRKIAGIAEDEQSFLEMLQSQFILNFRRIHSLLDLDLDKAVFLLSAQLMEENKVDGIGFQLLQSLKNRDFQEYYRLCMI